MLLVEHLAQSAGSRPGYLTGLLNNRILTSNFRYIMVLTKGSLRRSLKSPCQMATSHGSVRGTSLPVLVVQLF